MARALRAWAINRRGKNSVRNLRYGPRTRLVRGIHDNTAREQIIPVRAQPSCCIRSRFPSQLGRVVQSPIKLTQISENFDFSFRNSSMRFHVCIVCPSVLSLIYLKLFKNVHIRSEKHFQKKLLLG